MLSSLTGAAWSLFPARLGCLLSNKGSHRRRQLLRASPPALQAAFSGELVNGLGRQPRPVLDLARSDIDEELGELRGIARALGAAFGHKAECGGLRSRV